jgi:hypothetical protein
VWPWRVFSAVASVVVEHDSARTVLWIPEGAPVQWPPERRVTIPELAEGRWSYEERRWFGSRLMISERDTAHSVYAHWGKDGAFVGWYVNLEDPWRTSPFGFDTTDHLLDIWIEPDRTWRWKDEDHLAEAVEIGLFRLAQAEQIRREGERAIERIEAWTKPFDEGWEHWSSDPTWSQPSIPEGWDVV